MCYYLSKGVCPSGQQWEIPQASAGELETRGHQDQGPGEGGSPWLNGGSAGVFKSLGKKDEDSNKQGEHGFTECKVQLPLTGVPVSLMQTAGRDTYPILLLLSLSEIMVPPFVFKMRMPQFRLAHDS